MQDTGIKQVAPKKLIGKPQLEQAVIPTVEVADIKYFTGIKPNPNTILVKRNKFSWIKKK